MLAATRPLSAQFITPMAAVAGAVADEVLSALCHGYGITKAHINNGGDVAFYLTGTQQITAAIAHTPARITLTASDPWRGMATSGWRGRSHSLGIADSVTVLADNAAAADAAATLIANAVNLPNDPRISRQPARELAPDSDLSDRLVTTAVAPLDAIARAKALNDGLAFARTCLRQNLIAAAYLTLQGEARSIGQPAQQPETLNA